MAAEPVLTTYELLAIIGATVVGTTSIVAAVFGGANYLRKEFWRGFDKMQTWQKRHDQKDDRRFTVIDQQLFELKVRNSIRDGTNMPKHKPINDITNEGLDGDPEAN